MKATVWISAKYNISLGLYFATKASYNTCKSKSSASIAVFTEING